MSARSIVLALRARLDPRAAHALHAGHELRLGEDRFRIDERDGQLNVARGDARHPDATITSDTLRASGQARVDERFDVEIHDWPFGGRR